MGLKKSKKNPLYEAPRAISFSEIAIGAASCHDGPSASDCAVGTMASNNCNNGTTAGNRCGSGATPRV